MSEEILRFVGTGAAEGIPSPFCRCPICENARKVGGRELKTRTTFRVTEDVQIDYNADAFIQSALYGNDLFTLKHLLITHTHWDHFAVGELMLREMAYVPPEHELKVYLAEDAYDVIGAFDGAIRRNDERISSMLRDIVSFERISFYEGFQAGDVYATALKGAHHGLVEKNSALYHMVLPSGRSMLYALDTGYLPEETFEWLKGKKLDILVMEATFGDADRGLRPYGHLDIKSADQVMERLYAEGAIDDGTKVYLTHMNHKHHMTHRMMEEYYQEHRHPYEVQVAYDGLVI